MKPWTVKYNKDGTVTIPVEVYEKLRGKAEKYSILETVTEQDVKKRMLDKAEKYSKMKKKVICDQWIPISQKLPPEAEDVIVLVWVDDSYGKGIGIRHIADLGCFCTGEGDVECDGGFFWTCHDINEGQPCKVIAWMPLPEYEEEEK